MCHRHKLVYGFLTSTLSAITNAFPSQTLWPLLGLSKSQVQMRSQRALAVLKPFRTSSATNTHLVGVADAMIDELITVASDLPPEGADRTYTLRGLVDNPIFRDSDIILPLLGSMTGVLAPKAGSNNGLVHSDGFSRSLPKIHKFERQVDVMSSKEKPKKITIVANDGKRYHFLCKRERRGDLRKDARLMECASLVNRLLAKDGAGVRAITSMIS